MQKLIIKFLIFSALLLLILVGGLTLPATPRASKSLLFAKIAKDSLLANTPSPRIIFVGGSNISFGLNSQMIKDSLHLNPINTGILVSLGLIYMMDNTINYVKKGDIVVIASEYGPFFDMGAFGGVQLLETVMDISPNAITKLRIEQWRNIYRFLPKHASSKFMASEYFNITEHKLYGVSSFNKYGDVVAHWKLKKEKKSILGELGLIFNHATIDELVNFEKKIKEKGAILYVTFPACNVTSFEKNKLKIAQVESELRKTKLTLLGNAERYKIPDSMMFDSAYHPAKDGQNLRTRLLIEDLRRQN